MTAVTSSTAVRLSHRLARAQAESRMPSLVAGLVRGGALLWAGGCGRLPDGSVPGADVQYRIGSITKSFTAALILRLRDDGAVRLEDQLEDHVPATPLGERTLRDLLSHQAGLRAESPGDWWERAPGGAWDDLAATLTPGTLPHPAGQRFHYSNLGFGVLGEVVARRRGRPWADCVRDELLAPLGMDRTTTRPQAPAAPGLAVHPWADLVLPEPEHDAAAMAPAGQLWSTVTDLAVWAGVLTGDGGDVLRPETVEEMRTPIAIEQDPSGWFGYGLGVVAWPGGMVGHGGSMPGFLAVLVGRPGGDACVAMANATHGLDRTVTTDLLGILEAEEPAPPAEWTPAPAPADDVLELLGPWYWGPAPLVVRAARDGGLRLEGLGERARASRFVRDGDGWRGLDGYYAGERLTVVRRPDGRVGHLDLATFILTRQPYDPNAPIPGGVDPQGWRGAEPDPSTRTGC